MVRVESNLVSDFILILVLTDCSISLKSHASSSAIKMERPDFASLLACE